jgi:N-acetylglutamate synthase-like GNAT family acetyltransferase
MTKRYSIRVAEPADAEAVTALLKASYPVLMRQAYDEAILAAGLDAMTTANPKLLASGTYYLAESPIGRAVGCGGWTREAPGSSAVQSRVGHIRHFATDPAWAGLGIGRSIYAACEREARGAGVKEFTCYSSLNAAAFYAALGFENVGSIKVRLGAGVMLPGVLMRRRV